jgi:hypothetical protein
VLAQIFKAARELARFVDRKTENLIGSGNADGRDNNKNRRYQERVIAR